MAVPLRFAALAAADQWLIRQLQCIGFGRITFAVCRGSAAPSAGFRIARTQKLLAPASTVRSASAQSDFALCKEQVALLRHLRGLPDGSRVSLKVALGLPASSIDIEEEHLAA